MTERCDQVDSTPKNAYADSGMGIHSRRREYGGTLTEQYSFVEANRKAETGNGIVVSQH
jgi:hypothetical protein